MQIKVWHIVLPFVIASLFFLTGFSIVSYKLISCLIFDSCPQIEINDKNQTVKVAPRF